MQSCGSLSVVEKKTLSQPTWCPPCLPLLPRPLCTSQLRPSRSPPVYPVPFSHRARASPRSHPPVAFAAHPLLCSTCGQNTSISSSLYKLLVCLPSQMKSGAILILYPQPNQLCNLAHPLVLSLYHGPAIPLLGRIQ